MNFVVNNQEHFQTNSAVHSVNTRNRDHLHRPTAKLSCFQKSGYYAVIRMFSPPWNLRSLINKKSTIWSSVTNTLKYSSLHSVEEFLTFKNDSYVQKFSSLLLYGPCIICVYFVELFFMLTSQYFGKVFVYDFVILFVFFCCCCIYLYVLYLHDLFYILSLPLETYGSMECMHVCMNRYQALFDYCRRVVGK
jgi:hypothetical protein